MEGNEFDITFITEIGRRLSNMMRKCERTCSSFFISPWQHCSNEEHFFHLTTPVVFTSILGDQWHKNRREAAPLASDTKACSLEASHQLCSPTGHTLEIFSQIGCCLWFLLTNRQLFCWSLCSSIKLFTGESQLPNPHPPLQPLVQRTGRQGSSWAGAAYCPPLPLFGGVQCQSGHLPSQKVCSDHIWHSPCLKW